MVFSVVYLIGYTINTAVVQVGNSISMMRYVLGTLIFTIVIRLLIFYYYYYILVYVYTRISMVLASIVVISELSSDTLC